MPSPVSPIGELLAAVRAALEPLGIRWYLFGAQAAILYGAARLNFNHPTWRDDRNDPATATHVDPRKVR